MDRPLVNSYWVLPGSLLAGEYPYGGQQAEARMRLKRLLDAGIDAFIDLTQPGELPDYSSLLPARIDYHRYPIVDGSVPIELAQMRNIQAHLQTALAVGRRLYVHCRAGIGRTGTVIGCYLAEQGLDGQDALQQLNRLWQQCARSVSWPDVPQTPEQADFIRSWPRHRQIGVEAPAWAALRGLRGRFLGAMLGLAVGDALAAPTQYGRPGSFAAVGDLIGGGPFDLPRGAWSDDTAMTLCLAESLLECEGFDVPDQLRRYARWQREGYLSATGQCLGITAASARTLRRALAGNEPGCAQGRVEPSSEAAPLSRVAAAVLYYFAQEAQAIAQAEAAARVSDASPVVLDACRALAAMLHAALRGEALERVLRPRPPRVGARPLRGPIEALLASDPNRPPLPADHEPAVTALAAARWALATGGGFRGGALRATNIGGDADVIGAIHGQLAGAYYGRAAISAGWLAALAGREQIESLADRLLTVALVGLSEPVS